MRHPAALPGLALLAGAGAACCTRLAPAWPAAFASAAWVAAAWACGRRRDTAFAAAISAAFCCAAWALAAPSFRETESPALRTALGSMLPTSAPLVLRGELRGDASPGPNGIGLDLELSSLPTANGEEALAPGGGRGAATAPRDSSARFLVTGVRLNVAGSLAVDRIDEWRRGRSIQVAASLRAPARSLDPGVPDSRVELARRGTALVGGTKSGALVEVLARGSWIDERAADLRRFAREALARHVGRFSGRSAAIVVAILIGDRVGLDDETQRMLREAGTYHVIAISGGNIAILAALLFFLLRTARVPTRPACWLVIGGLTAYASLVGGGASVVRATLMAAAYLVARQADYRSPPLNALGVACAVILAATPLALVDPGFALTFGATLGILVGASWLGGQASPSREGAAPNREAGAARRGRWLRAPKALLLASISAELALFPVSAFAFSRVTFAGLALNFLAIPLMSVAQVAGMAVLPLDALGSRLAPAAGWLAHLGAEGLVRSAAFVDFVPWLTWRLPPPHPAALLAYYAGWCVLLYLRGDPRPLPPSAGPWRRRLSRPFALRTAALASILLAGLWILTEPITLLFPGVSGVLRATVLDVGHADAILIQLPDRRSILVDAGGSMAGGSFDIGGRVIAPALWALGTRRLDALLITHGDPDHIGGALSVMRDFRPREVWEGVPVPSLAGLAQLQDQARRLGAAWRQRRAGECLAFGDVTVRVHHPPPADWERRKVRNDDSVVVEVTDRDVSIVLPGDIGRGVERSIAPSLALRPARLRVLKVPHHGSATSSSPEFLEALRPDVAIISAAATTKVPDDVVARYRAVGATLFRTSDDGAVTLTTDGHTLEVETFTGKRMQISHGSTTKSTKVTKIGTQEGGTHPDFD